MTNNQVLATINQLQKELDKLIATASDDHLQELIGTQLEEIKQKIAQEKSDDLLEFAP